MVCLMVQAVVLGRDNGAVGMIVLVVVLRPRILDAVMLVRARQRARHALVGVLVTCVVTRASMRMTGIVGSGMPRAGGMTGSGVVCTERGIHLCLFLFMLLWCEDTLVHQFAHSLFEVGPTSAASFFYFHSVLIIS